MGDLTLTIIKATDLKPPSIFSNKSSMQCYCNIQFGSNYNWEGKVYKTKTAGKTNFPEWGNTFTVGIKNPTQSTIKILIKDKLSLMDNLVGEAQFPLGDQSLQKGKENIVTIPVKKGGSVKGRLIVALTPHTFGTAQNTVTVINQPTVVQQHTITTQTSPPPDPYAQGPYTTAPPPQGNPYGTSVPPPQGGNPYGTSVPPPQGGSPYGTTAPPPQGGNPYGSSVPPPQGGSPYGTTVPPPQGGNPYGNAPPQNDPYNPYGTAPPQNQYGNVPPPQNNPYGNVPPPQNNPYGQQNQYY